MAIKLAVGDVVELKSGGPLLTVVKDRVEQGSKFVQVAWFDGAAVLKQEVLPKDSLQVKGVKPSPEGAAVPTAE
ncbi:MULTISPECIES: DUF2158 domain-containing protein [unclassified Variovorax]|uniref:DUF2158 domain-containing protein n=1 Tax=unclassified Variovorax TaxID=663243 RepID=UPI00076D2074|nr:MULTISPECIES: DUF2158 domain-containing protein [unclassified Variovorax]KWT98473.1 hypothetical protein APY03_0608 [Variovorax sp. WDL1]PNG49852.1 hypothetical protein CHC06_05433 [Variovorax sp. B2]PNG50724.1 hypothetical protein CHC07_05338 [Variovorax sp. B4]VTV17927.1 hypothetical protein WDL1P1_00772 [Variovorax sp. WDL1]